MASEEWENLQEVYETYNADGSTEHTSVVTNCVEEDWGIMVTACTFLLGAVDNYQEMNLSTPEQRTAGWLNGAGDYGIRGY